MGSNTQRAAIFGSTGSIGTQALDIVRSYPDRLSVSVLSAWSNTDLLIEQAHEFGPECVVVGSPKAGQAVVDALADTGIRVLLGNERLPEAAAWPGVDVVLTAIVGSAGLELTLSALSCGRRVALANKETMVIAGDLVTAAATESGARIVPVDSEHSAIFQCLVGEKAEVRRLVLTASGGPFKDWTPDRLKHVTRKDALNHPNWDMGAKISVDSATMMNKGLEVIEAHWLFGMPPDRIDVVVHPQSIVHSMVEFADGSTMAQLGPPDMHLPIQYAFGFPDRWASTRRGMDWTRVVELTFEPPDMDRFPCLRLAYQALGMGPSATAVLNAVNEESVAAFLDDRLSYLGIAHVNEMVLDRLGGTGADSLQDRLSLDVETRRLAKELIGTRVH